MERSVRDVEHYIRKMTTSSSSAPAPRRMREIGAQLFADLRRQAEGAIGPKINVELDAKVKCPFEWGMIEGTMGFTLSMIFTLD